MDKNCPNCGAPYDVVLDKCPYCDTSYFDMSTMDINNQQPFYLKIRYGDMIFTSKVIAEPHIDINYCKDAVEAINFKKNRIKTIIRRNDVDVDIKFHSVLDDKGNLFTMRYEND